jgi:hypothetical protein
MDAAVPNSLPMCLNQTVRNDLACAALTGLSITSLKPKATGLSLRLSTDRRILAHSECEQWLAQRHAFAQASAQTLEAACLLKVTGQGSAMQRTCRVTPVVLR